MSCAEQFPHSHGKNQAVGNCRQRFMTLFHKISHSERKMQQNTKECVIEKTVFSQMLKRSMGLGCQHTWKYCSPLLVQICQKGGTQHLLNNCVMGFELGCFCTIYSLMQLLSMQGINLCHDRAWCSIFFWVFLKAPCKAELIPLYKLFLRHLSQTHFPYATREGNDSGCWISM